MLFKNILNEKNAYKIFNYYANLETPPLLLPLIKVWQYIKKGKNSFGRLVSQTSVTMLEIEFDM